MSDTASKPVALVTGAAQGIGEAIARMLGAAGYVVVLGDVDGGLVHQTASALQNRGIEATGIRLDVTKAADWAEACTLVENRWGGLDALVNNAAVSSRGTVETTDEAVWDLTLGVNLRGRGWASKPHFRSCAAQGDNHQHRLDPGNASHAGALSLCHLEE